MTLTRRCASAPVRNSLQQAVRGTAYQATRSNRLPEEPQPADWKPRREDVADIYKTKDFKQYPIDDPDLMPERHRDELGEGVQGQKARSSGVTFEDELVVSPTAETKNANVRRIARDVSPTYHHFTDPRMCGEYKGGWQNFLCKPQWFWFYFKKYGITNNMACHLHMREFWWQSGEKRLLGMDCMGVRYWETDLIMRDSLYHRACDWPHHFHWMEWSKMPWGWGFWVKFKSGRCPAQWEQLHRELGPEWRDYNQEDAHSSDNYQYGRHREEDSFLMNLAADSDSSCGADMTNPWHPDYKRKRRWYGYYKLYTTDQVRNQYDLDEYSPSGGARDWLDIEKNMQADNLAQEKVFWNSASEQTAGGMFGAGDGNMGGNNFTKMSNRWDGGDFFARCYWEFRQASADSVKISRKNVSAFDSMRHSPANKTGHNIFSAETNNYWMVKGDMAREGHNRAQPEAAAHSKSYWRNDMAYGKSHGSKGIFRAQ